MFDYLRADIKAVKERDPAARSSLEIFLLYPSVTALFWHRVAHKLYNIKLRFLARMISQLARFFTGIEIHPGAKIKKGCFIDHGMGVIIGEPAEIGANCPIYQGVTLGGTGKDVGKRHPTLGNNVMVGSGAKVLGPFTVGDNSKIAANAVVLSPVPPNSTCVGVPARVVKVDNIRVKDELDQTHIPDPISQELCKILHRVRDLEKELEKLKKDGNENENI